MSAFTILFLGAGKKVSLVANFLQSVKNLNLEPRLLSYEVDLYQPVSKLAEIILGKIWADPDVDDHLLQIIRQQEVNLVVSNVDPASIVQSRIRTLTGAALLCSEQFVVENCTSKKRFQEVCEFNELDIIPLASLHQFPKFGKPDMGSSSNGAMLIQNINDQNRLSKDLSYIYQEYIVGLEISVDCYITQSGSILGISPRIRVRTQGGESIETDTISDDEVINKSIEVIKKLNLLGPITIQFIREKSTDLLYLMEVNPRFGGGVNASIYSGFDFPTMMIREALDLEPRKIEFGRKVKMIKYFEEVYFEIDS
jgi:carbamoyl-phosphate synthase large subunit